MRCGLTGAKYRGKAMFVASEDPQVNKENCLVSIHRAMNNQGR